MGNDAWRVGIDEKGFVVMTGVGHEESHYSATGSRKRGAGVRPRRRARPRRARVGRGCKAMHEEGNCANERLCAKALKWIVAVKCGGVGQQRAGR